MTLPPAYHGDVQEKRATLRLLQAHREADEIIQGIYWDETEHRGCAVGCLTHTKGGGHGLFPDRWGIPENIAYLIDSIFEALPVDDAKDWPVRFMSAVPVGADLSGVWDRFALWMLDDLTTIPDCDPSVPWMAGLFRRAVAGDVPSNQEWDDAARAAWDAWEDRAAWDAWEVRADRAARAARAAWAAREARGAWGARGADELVRIVKTSPTQENP